MAFHNVAMRYFYAMGREGILPSALGRTHNKHKVPHIANVTQTGAAIVIMLLWGATTGFSFAMAFDGAYVRIYTMMAVQGVVFILAIQALCALAIIVYFRTGGRKGNVITTIICPVIAIAGQLFALSRVQLSRRGRDAPFTWPSMSQRSERHRVCWRCGALSTCGRHSASRRVALGCGCCGDFGHGANIIRYIGELLRPRGIPMYAPNPGGSLVANRRRICGVPVT